MSVFRDTSDVEVGGKKSKRTLRDAYIKPRASNNASQFELWCFGTRQFTLQCCWDGRSEVAGQRLLLK